MAGKARYVPSWLSFVALLIAFLLALAIIYPWLIILYGVEVLISREGIKIFDARTLPERGFFNGERTEESVDKAYRC